MQKKTIMQSTYSFDHSTHEYTLYYTIFSLEAALIQKSQDKHRHVYAVAKGITNKLGSGEQFCFCFDLFLNFYYS